MRAVIKRFIVFCKEQNKTVFHKYRALLRDLSPAQLKGLEMRKTYQVQKDVQLYDIYSEEYNYDVDTLGEKIESIIPCLDPETPDYAKTQFEVVSQRININDPLLVKLSSSMSSQDLAMFDPHFWPFIPSPEIQEKLFMRMASVQDEDQELWQGFGLSVDQARVFSEEVEQKKKEEEEMYA